MRKIICPVNTPKIFKRLFRWRAMGIDEAECQRMMAEAIEKKRAWHRDYRKKHDSTPTWREYHRSKAAQYRAENPSIHRKILRESYRRHASRRRLDAKIQRDKIKQDPIRLSQHNSKVEARRKRREQSDLIYKISRRLRNRIKQAISSNYKTGSALELLGCSVEFFKSHMESLWRDGMNWENYGIGGWTIDHKRPCVSFDLSDPEQQKECFHYSNTQPLWGTENSSNGATLRRV